MRKTNLSTSKLVGGKISEYRELSWQSRLRNFSSLVPFYIPLKGLPKNIDEQKE